MKIAYQIFHVDTNTKSSMDRKELTIKAKQQLDKAFTELGSESVYLFNEAEVEKYFSKKGYVVTPSGFNNRGWKLGELGIWASNIEAWEKFLESDYDAVILMEDDIVLANDFNKRLVDLLNRLPDNWELFSGFVPATSMRRWRRNSKAYKIGDPEIAKLFQTWSCLCYVVTKSAVEKILNKVSNGIDVPIDSYLFDDNSTINSYSITYQAKNLCSLGHNLPSTIQDAEFKDITVYP